MPYLPANYLPLKYEPFNYLPGFGRPASPVGPGVLNDYIITFVEGLTFYVGDVMPLKWNITRKDGAPVAATFSATVRVTDGAGVTTTVAATQVTPAPINTLVMGRIYTFAAHGYATATLSLTLDSETIIDQQTLIVC